MTREVEIGEKALEYSKRKFCPPDSALTNYDIFNAFTAGAEWADQHQKGNLAELDKVCEWIKNNAAYYAHWEWNGDTYEKEVVFDAEGCAKAFKQSMKGE